MWHTGPRSTGRRRAPDATPLRIVHVREAGYVRLCCAGCAGTPRWPSGLRQRTSNPCYAGSNPARGADRRPSSVRGRAGGGRGSSRDRGATASFPGRARQPRPTAIRSRQFPARGRPRPASHSRGWILVGRVRRCLARRCSIPAFNMPAARTVVAGSALAVAGVPNGQMILAVTLPDRPVACDPVPRFTQKTPVRRRHVRIVMALDPRVPKTQVQASSEERQGDGRRRIQ